MDDKGKVSQSRSARQVKVDWAGSLDADQVYRYCVQIPPDDIIARAETFVRDPLDLVAAETGEEVSRNLIE